MTETTHPTMKHLGFIAAIVVAAHLLFLTGTAFMIAPDGTLASLVDSQDARGYVDLANALRNGEGFYLYDSNTPEAFRTPGYPLLLAVVFSLTNGSLLAALIVTAIIAGLAASCIYSIGEAVGLPRIASSASAILFGLSPAVLLLTPTGMGGDLLYTLLVLGAFVLTMRGNHANLRLLFLIGFLLGVAALVRPLGYFLGIILCLLIPYMWSIPVRRYIVSSAILLAGLFLVISPWLVRNVVIAGQFTLSSIPAYSAAYYNIPAYFAFTEDIPPQETNAKLFALLGNPGDEELRTFAYTKALTAYDKAFLKEHLIPYFFFHVYKTIPFFTGSGLEVVYLSLAPVGNFAPMPLFAGSDADLTTLLFRGNVTAVATNLLAYWPTTLERITWVFVLLACLAAPFVTRAKTRRFAIVCVLLVLLSAGLAGPVSQPRYRIPVEPFMLLTASLTLASLYKRYDLQ